MKQLCMTLTGALAALAVASCNKTDSAMPNGGGASDGRVAVQFSAGSLDVRPDAPTRGDWTIRDGKIGIYVLDATESTIADGYANVGYRFDAERRIFVPLSETIYFPVDGSKRRFVAYSPCREVVDGLFKVDLSEQPAPEEQGARELLWTDVTPAYDKTTPDVRLEFKHQYARITVRVKSGAGLTGEDLKGARRLDLRHAAQGRFPAPDGDDDPDRGSGCADPPRGGSRRIGAYGPRPADGAGRKADHELQTG